MEMRVYVANLGKYNEGELVGAWFEPPIDYDEMAERIGLNEQYEEYAIHDYELPFDIEEYTPIEEVNCLCEMVADLSEYIQDNLKELQGYFSSFEDLCEHQDDIILWSGCEDMADVTRQMVEEGALGEIPAHLRQLSVTGRGARKDTGGVGFVPRPFALGHLEWSGFDVKKIRSYSSIWSVEKVIYAINDMRLPFPITFSQMAWFVTSELAVLALGELPPLSMIDGALLKYFGIPVGITWFMSQKTWDGKKPFSFVKSYTAYLLRPKQTFAGKPVKFRKEKTGQPITAVRSVMVNAVSDQVKQPWLLLQFGDTDTDALGEDRVESLLSAGLSENNGENRENVVKTEIEDNGNTNLTVTKTVNRLGTVFFLFLFNIGISVFVFLLTGMMICSQVLFIIYVMFLPVSFVLSMVPTFEGSSRRPAIKLFNTILARAGITLVITVAFSVSTMLYQIADRYPFFIIAFLQVVLFAGTYFKLGDLLSLFSLRDDGTRSMGRHIVRRPGMFLYHQLHRLNRSVRSAASKGKTGSSGNASGRSTRDTSGAAYSGQRSRPNNQSGGAKTVTQPQRNARLQRQKPGDRIRNSTPWFAAETRRPEAGNRSVMQQAESIKPNARVQDKPAKPRPVAEQMVSAKPEAKPPQRKTQCKVSGLQTSRAVPVRRMTRRMGAVRNEAQGDRARHHGHDRHVFRLTVGTAYPVRIGRQRWRRWAAVWWCKPVCGGAGA